MTAARSIAPSDAAVCRKKTPYVLERERETRPSAQDHPSQARLRSEHHDTLTWLGQRQPLTATSVAAKMRTDEAGKEAVATNAARGV